MRKFLVVLVLMALVIGGCQSAPVTPNIDPIAQATATMGNTLITTKKTVIEAMVTISNSCQMGTLSVPICNQAEKLYLKIQPAINAAEQSIIISATTGDLTQANENQAAVNAMVAELLELKGVN